MSLVSSSQSFGSGKVSCMVEKENIRVIGERVYELRGECTPDACDLYCCRHAQFLIDKVHDDDKKYFEGHGFTVIEEGQKLRVLVKKDCDYLDIPNCKCGIYQDRPTVCQMFADRNDLPFRPTDCSLKWHELRGRRADVILSRRRKE